MKKTFTITLTMDTEKAWVTDLDITEGLYNRTEFILDGVDDPISLNDAVKLIREEIAGHIE